MAIRILSDQNVKSNVIAIQAFRLGTDSLWKIRGNAANTELAFEYSTSSALSDANIKVVFNSSGAVGIGDNVTPSQKLHVAGNIYSINSGTDGGQIRLANSGGGSNWYWAARTTGLNLGELGVADGNIFIANGGNVGIDTTDQTPEKFNVDGNIIMVGGSTNTGYDRYFKIYGNTQPVNNPNRWAGMAVYNNGGNNVNELAFFTGSGDDARTEKVRIDSGGRVGIGTDDPQSKLQIVDEVSTSIKMYSTYNYSLNRNWAIQLNGFGPGNWGGISFLQSTAQDLAPTVPVFGITRAGNVGIGINASNTAVDHKLHVNGSIKIANSNSRLVFGTSGGTDRRALEGNVDGTLLQVGESYSKIAMYGNVGIGTTSPTNKLGISSTSINTNERIINLYTGTTGPGKYVSIGAQYSTSNALSNSEIRFGNEVQSSSPSFLAFATGSSSTPTERMRITSGGNVGIGTTNPSSELEVDGRAIVEKLEVARYSDSNAPAAVYVGRSANVIGQGGIFRLGAIESSSTVNKINEPFLITYSSGHWGSQPMFFAEFTITYYRGSYIKYWAQHEVSGSRLEIVDGPYGGQIISGGAPVSRTITQLCTNCHGGQPVYKCVWKWSNSGTYIKTSPIVSLADGPGTGRVYTSGSSSESAIDTLYGSASSTGSGYLLMGINNAQAAGFTGLQTQN